MATSGSYNWTLNRDQVITGALRKLSAIPSGATPSSSQVSDCNDALNALIKAFAADGMPVWATTNYAFTTVAGTAVYSIGIGQTLNTVAPLKVIQATYSTASNNSAPMTIYNRYDFNLLPDSSDNTGTPVILYYQPLEDSGAITLWPFPIDNNTTITINYQRPYQDMDASTDNFDFPSYWIQALIYNLAWVMSPEYGIPPTDRNIIAQEAKYWKDEALGYGTEEGSMYMQPDTMRG